MIVTIQLFARARELVGCDNVPLALGEDATVADVRRELARTYPQLAVLVGKCAVAVNDDYADDSCLISAEAVLALLPPVSGGYLY